MGLRATRANSSPPSPGRARECTRAVPEIDHCAVNRFVFLFCLILVEYPAHRHGEITFVRDFLAPEILKTNQWGSSDKSSGLFSICLLPLFFRCRIACWIFRWGGSNQNYNVMSPETFLHLSQVDTNVQMHAKPLWLLVMSWILWISATNFIVKI